jgi:hypothetical protein
MLKNQRKDTYNSQASPNPSSHSTHSNEYEPIHPEPTINDPANHYQTNASTETLHAPLNSDDPTHTTPSNDDAHNDA